MRSWISFCFSILIRSIILLPWIKLTHFFDRSDGINLCLVNNVQTIQHGVSRYTKGCPGGDLTAFINMLVVTHPKVPWIGLHCNSPGHLFIQNIQSMHSYCFHDRYKVGSRHGTFQGWKERPEVNIAQVTMSATLIPKYRLPSKVIWSCILRCSQKETSS